MENVPTEGNDGKKDKEIDISNLPEIALLEIFGYLKLDELCKAGSVCKRWNEFSKNESLWKSVDVHHIELTSQKIGKLFRILPNNTTRLRIYRFPIRGEGEIHCGLRNNSYPGPLLGERFASKEAVIPFHELQNQCPNLETLIMDSVVLSDSRNEHEFGVWSLPLRLKVLSVARSQIRVQEFFEKNDHPSQQRALEIQILDFTECRFFPSNPKNLFSKLSNLQELYLAGCAVSDHELRKIAPVISGLKVLDLENTNSHETTFSVLNECCVLLEELFISGRWFFGDHLRSVQPGFLPNLKVLCLKGTRTRWEALRALLQTLPNVETMNGLPRNEVLYEGVSGDYREICEHFLLREKSFRFQEE